MKKLLAVLLAVAMIATVAFADDLVVKPGSKWAIEPANLDALVITEKMDISGADVPEVEEGDPAPTVADLEKKGEAAWNIENEDFTADYFKVTIKFDKGETLVDKCYFDDDDDLDEIFAIKFKQNYEKKFKTDPNKDEILIDTLEIQQLAKGDNDKITIKFDSDEYDGGAEEMTRYLLTNLFKKTAPAPENEYVVYGYEKDSIALVSDDETPIDDNLEGITVFEDGDAYGIISFDTGDYTDKDDEALDVDATVEFRAYDEDEMFLYFDNGDGDINKELQKKYADDVEDEDDDLTFLRFKGAPTIGSKGKIIFDIDEEYFVYEVVDGKLVKSNAKVDDDGDYSLKTSKLGYYCVSPVELSVAAAADENPNTGAL